MLRGHFHACPEEWPVTLADLLALEEDVRRRYELIGGELVERGAATGRHEGAQGQAFHLLSPYALRRNVLCTAYARGSCLTSH